MMKMFMAGLCTAVVLVTSCNNEAEQQGWVDLFDGKTLSGWKQVGGDAKYVVEEGMIVGTTQKNTDNSFIITEKEYGDYILELDAKIEGERNNSGIQIRSHFDETAGGEKGRVYGRQVEIDPTDRGWTGGIYDEARRGWLYPLDLNTNAKKTFKNNKFNHFRIECIGNETKVWLNDELVSHLIDTIDPSGFIGLQVHSVNRDEDAGEKVYFKNIRIQTDDLQSKAIDSIIYVVNLKPNSLSEQEQRNGYHLLFNGKDGTGWRGFKRDNFPEKGWDVQDGILKISKNIDNEKPWGGDIITEEQFTAFDLSFEFLLTPGANSGLKYFVQENSESGGPVGLEYQLLDDERHPDAKMGRDGNRTIASLYDLITSQKQTRFMREIGEWNSARIIAHPDNKIEHFLNGVLVLSYDRYDQAFKDLVQQSKFRDIKEFGEVKQGPILLQDHGDEVSFRSIKIRKL